MDCVLCALNSEIMSFSRFAPHHSQWWGRPSGKRGLQACEWHQPSGLAASDIILLFSLMFVFQLPPLRTSGPHTAPGSASEPPCPPRNTRRRTGLSGASGAGKGSPTRGPGLTARVTAKPFRNLFQKKTWRVANGNHVQHNSRVSNTHAHRQNWYSSVCGNSAKTAHHQDPFYVNTHKGSTTPVYLSTTRGCFCSKLTSCFPLHARPSWTRTPVTWYTRMLISQVIFVKAQNGSNLIFSPSWKILFYSTYKSRKIYLVYNNALGK